MRKFQGIVFIWTQTYREILKSATRIQSSLAGSGHFKARLDTAELREEAVWVGELDGGNNGW